MLILLSFLRTPLLLFPSFFSLLSFSSSLLPSSLDEQEGNEEEEVDEVVEIEEVSEEEEVDVVVEESEDCNATHFIQPTTKPSFVSP